MLLPPGFGRHSSGLIGKVLEEKERTNAPENGFPSPKREGNKVALAASRKKTRDAKKGDQKIISETV